MKTNGIISSSTLRNIGDYWLYTNGRYIYCEKGLTAVSLPTIGIEYKCILEENGILYQQVSDTLLEYWDEDCYEEVSITCPTFIHWGLDYRQVKDHTGNVITSETKEAAHVLQWEIVFPAFVELQRQERERAIKRAEEELARKKETFFNNLIKVMGESNAAVVEDEFVYQLDIPNEGISRKLNGKNIKVFNVCHLTWHMWTEEIATTFCIAFNIDQLPSNGILELKVPKGTEGLVIGTDGWQVKKWAKALGLKYIYVTEKEE